MNISDNIKNMTTLTIELIKESDTHLEKLAKTEKDLLKLIEMKNELLAEIDKLRSQNAKLTTDLVNRETVIIKLDEKLAAAVEALERIPDGWGTREALLKIRGND